MKLPICLIVSSLLVVLIYFGQACTGHLNYSIFDYTKLDVSQGGGGSGNGTGYDGKITMYLIFPAQAVSYETEPIVRVAGLKFGDRVEIFTDNQCENRKILAIAVGNSLDLQLPNLKPNIYSFFAKVTSVEGGSTGCLNDHVSYSIDLSLDPNLKSITNFKVSAEIKADLPDALIGDGICAANDGVTGKLACSLRAAFDEANAIPNGEPLVIDLSEGIYNINDTILLKRGPTFFKGAGQDKTTISQIDSTKQILYISSGLPVAASGVPLDTPIYENGNSPYVILRDMTFAGGGSGNFIGSHLTIGEFGTRVFPVTVFNSTFKNAVGSAIHVQWANQFTKILKASFLNNSIGVHFRFAESNVELVDSDFFFNDTAVVVYGSHFIYFGGLLMDQNQNGIELSKCTFCLIENTIIQNSKLIGMKARVFSETTVRNSSLINNGTLALDNTDATHFNLLLWGGAGKTDSSALIFANTVIANTTSPAMNCSSTADTFMRSINNLFVGTSICNNAVETGTIVETLLTGGLFSLGNRAETGYVPSVKIDSVVNKGDLKECATRDFLGLVRNPDLPANANCDIGPFDSDDD